MFEGGKIVPHRSGAQTAALGCASDQGQINSEALVSAPYIADTVGGDCATSGTATGVGNSAVGSTRGLAKAFYSGSIFSSSVPRILQFRIAVPLLVDIWQLY